MTLESWRVSQWTFTNDIESRLRFIDWSDQDLMISLGETIAYELTELPNPNLKRLVNMTKEHVYELIRRDRLKNSY